MESGGFDHDGDTEEGAGAPVYAGHRGEFWPDPEVGPYRAFTEWAIVADRLVCVAMGISSVPLQVLLDDNAGHLTPVAGVAAPVASDQLRRPPWKQIQRRGRDTFASVHLALSLPEETLERIGRSMRAAGIAMDDAGWRDWLDHMAAEEKALLGVDADSLLGGVPPRTRHTGRKREMSEDEERRWIEVYRFAVRQGHPPIKVLADEFKVSATKAKNRVAAIRRRGVPLPHPPRSWKHSSLEPKALEEG